MPLLPNTYCLIREIGEAVEDLQRICKMNIGTGSVDQYFMSRQFSETVDAPRLFK